MEQPDALSEPFALNDPLAAMRQALAKAEKAAQSRAEAKAERRQHQHDLAREEEGDPDLEALAQEALAELSGPSPPLITESFDMDEGEDLDLLVALAAKDLVEENRDEHHGDLVLMREPTAPPAWYTEAAEQALPAGLKGSSEPLELKLLMQALLVEVGDVKRTNAMLLDKLIGMEEEVRAVRRLMRGKN